MKTWIFICMAVAILLWFLSTLRRKPSQKKGCIDAIIPAYNEGPCLAQSLDNLLRNPYFCRVICVNDGSTDNTEAVMAEVKRKWGDRFIAVTQKNTGEFGLVNPQSPSFYTTTSFNSVTPNQVTNIAGISSSVEKNSATAESSNNLDKLKTVAMVVGTGILITSFLGLALKLLLVFGFF